MDPQQRVADKPSTREDHLQTTINNIDAKLKTSSSQKLITEEQRKAVEETLIMVNSRQPSNTDLLAVIDRIEGKKKKQKPAGTSATKVVNVEQEQDQECAAFSKRLNENLNPSTAHTTRIHMMIKELEAKVHPATKEPANEQTHERHDSMKAAIDQSAAIHQLNDTGSVADASSVKRYLDGVKKDLFKKKEVVDDVRGVGDLQPAFSYKAGDIFSYFEQEKRKIYRRAQAELSKPASSIGKNLTLEEFSKGLSIGRHAPTTQTREDPKRSNSRQSRVTAGSLLLLKRDRSLASFEPRTAGGQLNQLISKLDRRSPKKVSELLERERKLLSTVQPVRLSTPSHLTSAHQIRRKFFY